MRVLTWNIQGNNGIGKARRERVVDAIAKSGADVVMLQEVAWRKGLHEDLRDRLAALGLEFFAYSGRIGSSDKRYGNAIASRYPLRTMQLSQLPPWPQSLLAVRAETPIGELEIVSAHIPNGSANGWAKVETFEALAAHLARPTAVPRVVGGDFNEPQHVEPNGDVVSFGHRRRKDGTWKTDGDLRAACKRTFPRARWQNAVERVLTPEAEHGLVHAISEPTGRHGFEPTHVVRGQPRYFDHLLVDQRLRVTGAGYRHEWREERVSDHSGVFADLERAAV